jgi:predicted phosphodiesterase
MALRFVHLSDIHFGQEKGDLIYIHDDVRERLLDDVEDLVRSLPGGTADGIVVTGDLAFSGDVKEYETAGKFLDRLAEKVGCLRTAVQIIPGNHDIHRKSICKSSEWMLGEIAEKGEAALDGFLIAEQDRDVLYGRLKHYRKFAEAYDCPLDGAGGIAGEKFFEIAPGRTLRFIGLNSALTCGSNDKSGKLLLGAKQWVLPRNRGEELVVLCHHPVHWFRDSVNALKYVRSRARVFISGHEHDPKFDVESIEDGCDLLALAAGAMTPPKETEVYTFTYNVIDFDWSEDKDALKVTLRPRVWNGPKTRFDSNNKLPGCEKNPVVLACPNFRAAAASVHRIDPSASDLQVDTISVEPPILATQQLEGHQMDEQFPLQLLRFFRDLTGAQRLAVLIKVGALPEDWIEPLNHSSERHALDGMKQTGRLADLTSAIDEVIASTGNGDGKNA